MRGVAQNYHMLPVAAVYRIENRVFASTRHFDHNKRQKLLKNWSIPQLGAQSRRRQSPGHSLSNKYIAVTSATSSTSEAYDVSSFDEREIQQLASNLDFNDLWKLMRPDWRLFVACAAATFVSVASSVSVAPALGKVIDVISAPSSSIRQLAVAIGTLGAVYIASNISLALQVTMANATGESLAARLRSRLFKVLLNKPTTFYDGAKTGDMTAWLGQDIEILQTTVSRLMGARGLRAILDTFGIILVLAWLSWPLALALLVAAPLVTPLVAAATKNIRSTSGQAQAAAAAASAAADEMVENIRIVRAFGAEKSQLSRYQQLIDVANQLALKVVKYQAILDVGGRFRNVLCILVTMTLGAHLALFGKVSIGVCYSFFVYSFSFSFALSNVTNTLGDLSKAAGTIARVMWVLKKTEASESNFSSDEVVVDDDDNNNNKRKNDNGIRIIGMTIPRNDFQGEIEFKNVCFRHPLSGWTMTNINLRIPAGSTVAFVGPSGGGKSTIASLILGLYTPDSGEIIIDGKYPLHALDMQWWRQQCGMVEQAPGLLIGGPVDEVVKYGKPDASKEQVQSVLQAAQATEFVESLPQKASTMLGPGGIELSGGQRQRLALARALLKDPTVLILDEATSALDVETENAVVEGLEALLSAEDGKKRTTIIIAHRLSTVRRADWTVVVSGGKIVDVRARGTGVEEVAIPAVLST